MEPPDDDSFEPRRFSLECDEIANAAFIPSPAIVDHQNVARQRSSERFQEHIDAADVASWQHASRHPTAGYHRFDIRGSTAHWDLRAYAPVCKVGGG
jgi:hypothetical protein